MIVNIGDFVGKYELHTGMYVNSKLQNYIDKYEPKYLTHLLGVELYNDFISDLDLNNEPQSPNFQAVYFPFSKEIWHTYLMSEFYYQSDSLVISEGIKEMLKGFIYFEYAKDLYVQMTPYGQVKPTAENSQVTSTLFSMMYTRYNEAIDTYRAIQKLIRYDAPPPLGQAVLATLLTGGSGYAAQLNVALTGGTGTGLTVDWTIDLSGAVDGVVINEQGTGYTIGDTFVLPTGNDDATIELTYVGIGDYKKFRGVPKSTAYWL